MPRERRAWEPGRILGVVGRAHEGRPIFAGEDDRRFFVPDRVSLLAWALQVDHDHLVSRVHDERAERRARLKSAGWRPANLVEAVCARLDADPAHCP